METSTAKNLPESLSEGREPLLWILEDDDDSMFVYREIFDFRYRLVEFRCLEDLSRQLESFEDANYEYPDLMIADLRLGDGNFFRSFRAGAFDLIRTVPLIIVSSCDDLDVIRDSFSEGSMDYLVKPFTRNEVIVKVDRYLKRTPGLMIPSSEKLQLVPDQLMLRRGMREPVRMTPKEIAILSVFKAAGGAPVHRDFIRRSVWGDIKVGAKTLDVHMANLRKKVMRLGCQIGFLPPDYYKLLGDWVDS